MKINYIHAVPVGDSIRLIYGIEQEETEKDAYKYFLQRRNIVETRDGQYIEEIPRKYNQQ